MKHQTIKRILVFSLCAVMISLSGCSKGEEKQEQKEKEVVTTVLEKLFTIPNQKMQDAYEEATKMAEQAAAETTECTVPILQRKELKVYHTGFIRI